MLTIATITRHIRPIVINVIHEATNSRDIHIEAELRRLNERKEFVKVITLFDKHKYQPIGLSFKLLELVLDWALSNIV